MRHRVLPGIQHLWLTRHGQSVGNVAAAVAEEQGALRIDIATRDMDVPLSPLGERQARALGAWFHAQPTKPTVILASPFARAMRTAELVADAIDDPKLELAIDERLRERDLGRFDRHTVAGVRAEFPNEAAERIRLGKFYYRPPGGESWVDVVLRMRSVFDHIGLSYAGERVLIVGHHAVVLCARYILERLDEHTLMEIDAAGSVGNCGITAYREADEKLGLTEYNIALSVA